MNISTGLYRLAQVIKWGGRILGGILFVLIVNELFTSTPQLLSNILSDRIVVICLIVGFIAVTEVVAWVLEGFSND